MFFFALYMTFDSLYRITSVALIIFVSFFIISSYYYSLNVLIIDRDKAINESCKWFGMWTDKDEKVLKAQSNASNLYFRYSPYIYQWILLIVMKLLNTINTLFKDKDLVQQLEISCYETIRENYHKVVYNYNIVRSLVNNILIYIYIIIMIFYLKDSEVNLISFILIIQNTLLIATVCKMESSVSNLNL